MRCVAGSLYILLKNLVVSLLSDRHHCGIGPRYKYRGDTDQLWPLAHRPCSSRGSLLEVCPDANMATPHSWSDNTPTVSWSTQEASTIKPVVADLIRICTLHPRHFFKLLGLIPLRLGESHGRWLISPFWTNRHPISFRHARYLPAAKSFVATLSPTVVTAFMCDLHAV